ncbi:spore coat protein [Evansella sp. LMS18]|jgi:spore coat protein F|uniref:spore coat protein n=1 Tax=Evansella sp. LMS18 TaxID=2924033 RepID=UPI0020D041BE|nr:spore coat protein [Evansella sp. LMS18]UTR08659.1 spore coat protein [Evansella sp. LMS18]
MNEKHLAWHETLEIHELTAMQSIGLMKLKKALPEIKERELQQIYRTGIQGLTANLNELLEFFPNMPRDTEEEEERADSNVSPAFYAGDLLALAKTSVRNYAIAITETATPSVRQVLRKQLNRHMDLHAAVFNYMYKNSYYPAYNLEKLLDGDVRLARKALSMRDE